MSPWKPRPTNPRAHSSERPDRNETPGPERFATKAPRGSERPAKRALQGSDRPAKRRPEGSERADKRAPQGSDRAARRSPEGSEQSDKRVRQGSERPARRAPGGSERAGQKAPRGPESRPGFSHCAIKETCQSCRYVNEPYEAALALKHRDGLAELEQAGVLGTARTLPPVVAPKPLGYRAAIKLAVRPALASPGDVGRYAIGLFKPGTHEVVDVSFCPLHMPAIGKLIRALKKELEAATSLRPWDETTREGDLRYLAVRASHVTSELMLTFVTSHLGCRVELKEMVRRLREAEHPIHAAFINVNTSEGNQIFGPESVRIAGQTNLRESLCGLKFEVGPTSFFQVNPWQAENVYRRIEQLVSVNHGEAVAWDLYCGGAQIAMILARAGFRVLGIEENPGALEDGRLNARRNGLEADIEFLAGRVEDVASGIAPWAKNPDLIVVNPSRRGLAESTRADLIRVLGSSSRCQLLYVSCEVKTLARDLAELVRSGYKVRQIEAFDMFAQTDKLEWLAIMTP